MKRCSKCRTEKEDTEFHRSAKAVSGLQSQCKVCQKNRIRKREMVSYVCSDCGQRNRRVARSPYVEVQRRTRCHRCSIRSRMDANGGRTTNYTGTEFFSGKTISQWKFSAGRRGHVWELSKEDLDPIFVAQGRKCALSGLPMGGEYSSPFRPSLDRIDSSLGYTAENVQFVCSVVNVMKNKLEEGLFTLLCAAIGKGGDISAELEQAILQYPESE